MTAPRTEKPEYRLGLRLLAEGPLTAMELAGELSIAKRNATEYIRIWKAEHKVRVIEWRRCLDGKPGDFIPIYGMTKKNGPRSDAPRPAPLTNSQKNRRHRIKHRAMEVLKDRERKGRGGNPFSNLLLAPIDDDLDRPHGVQIAI